MVTKQQSKPPKATTPPKIWKVSGRSLEVAVYENGPDTVSTLAFLKRLYRPFYCYYQNINPSLFYFLLQIRAFVILT